MAQLVTLWVGVYGEGTSFSLSIPCNVSVYDLQKEIAKQCQIHVKDVPVDSGTLSLYFTRKKTANGCDEWLQANSKLKSWLQKGRSKSASYVKMIPAWNLGLDYLGAKYDLGRRNIHILVELNQNLSLNQPTLQPPLKKQRRSINFIQFCQEAKQRMPHVNIFPNIEGLKAYLLLPWPVKVDILKNVLTPFIFAENALRVDCEAMTASINTISLICDRKMPRNASVVDWVSSYDAFLNLTSSICLAIGLDINYNRYQLEANSTISQPDCLVYTMKGLVLLRGEEKSGNVDIGISLMQLTSKMNSWNPLFYGELPYTLGFATSGELMKIVAIDRFKGIHEIISDQSVLTTQGQGKWLRVFFNLAFLFQSMKTKAKRSTSICLLPFTALKSDNHTVELIDEGIHFTYTTESQDFHRIVKIYQTLNNINRKPGGRVHLQMVKTFDLNSTNLKILLFPLGLEKQPSTVEEVREWIIAMLTALSLWHGVNFCHGNINWRNIVQVPNQAKIYWVLINMETSHPPNTRRINWGHPFNGKTLNFEHDLYQLGDLLRNFTFKLTNELENVKTALLENIQTKLTAAEILELLKRADLNSLELLN